MKKSLLSITVLAVFLTLFTSCTTKYNPNNVDPSELIKVTLKPNLHIHRVDEDKCNLLTMYLPGKLYLEAGEHVISIGYSDGQSYTTSDMLLDYNFIPGYTYKITYQFIGGKILVMARPNVETVVKDFSKKGFDTPDMNDSIRFLNILPGDNDYAIIDNLQVVAKDTLKYHTSEEELMALASECAAELGADAIVDMKFYHTGLTKIVADCTLIKYAE